MDQEEILKMIEAAMSKGGVHVAGDIVAVKNVEHEVSNVEAGGIGIQIVNNGPAEVKREGGKGGRPKKSGKKITKSFIYEAGEGTNVRLQRLYEGLIEEKWIKADTDQKVFLDLFLGGETTNRVIWTGDINTLTELFKELVTRKKYVRLPEGESIWVMVNAHFWEKRGNQEFGNERLAATRTPGENKGYIDALVRIMNPMEPIDDLERRLKQGQE